MQSLLHRFALAGAAALLIGSSALAPVSAAPLDPAPNPGEAKIETHFLSGMIPHHRDAIAMAQMAAMKATRPELRAMAQNIISDQQMEVDQMSRWLKDWYGLEAPAGTMMPSDVMAGMMPMMNGRMPDMDAAMRDLDAKTGGDFDVAFMSAMSHHHAMAVAMAGPVLMGGHHADLFTRAENIVISQGQEIKQMDEWLDTWYGVKRPLEGPVTGSMPLGR